MERDIIVVGASAGGVEALLELVRLFPKDFKGSVFIVLHIPPNYKSTLDQVLTRSGALKAEFPKDGDTIQNGHIYLAPPDHHLLVENDKVLVKKGPKENRFRPSIDALFRSAAYSFGPRVIGIVLSGMMDDGTSGLWSVKRLGGKVIVQDPAEAIHDSMPQNVLEQVDVDHVVPVREIPGVLKRLMAENIEHIPALNGDQDLIELEVKISAQVNAFESGIMEKGKLSPFTCPECHGALISLKEGPLTRFRCHTGHGYSSSALLAELTKSVEESLWNTLRGMEETIMLLDTKGKELEERGDGAGARAFFKKMVYVRDQSHIIRQSILQHEQLSEEKIDETGTK
jgi:two-component system chemotaxis response regulator CheB